jgi:hypothetical protein
MIRLKLLASPGPGHIDPHALTITTGDVDIAIDAAVAGVAIACVCVGAPRYKPN